MDLQLYFRVLWRFRYLVAVGTVAAVVLTVISIAHVSFTHGLSYRQHEEYSSTTMVFVTQQGFPLGRAVFDKFLDSNPKNGDVGVPVYSDPFRFSNVAALYTSLVTSDAVKRVLLRSGPVNGTISAEQPFLQNGSGTLLPYVQITATAPTAAGAVDLANRARDALDSYVVAQQTANGIDPQKRVLLQVVNTAQSAKLAVKRSLTRPIVVLLATLMFVIGLAFLLENLRPRVRSVEVERTEATPAAAARRTA